MTRNKHLSLLYFCAWLIKRCTSLCLKLWKLEYKTFELGICTYYKLIFIIAFFFCLSETYGCANMKMEKCFCLQNLESTKLVVFSTIDRQTLKTNWDRFCVSRNTTVLHKNDNTFKKTTHSKVNTFKKLTVSIRTSQISVFLNNQ